MGHKIGGGGKVEVLYADTDVEESVLADYISRRRTTHTYAHDYLD